ncbi:MAG TPA: MFS transporter [Candidatus Dormibacteraeota bacterium]|nr:MFS transporter [Candidatus Dormibacteraeota bacterium]
MRRIFYGWWIVAVAFVTHCITTGIVFYSFGVFLPALTEAFGWSRAQASFGFSLASLCGAFYSPAVGRVVDRRGSRPSQLVGAVAMASGFWLLHGMASLTEFYLVMGAVVSLGATALGGLPSNAAVTRWFVRRRGQALGIATAGISMGGVIFVPLTQWLIARCGWRGAFGWLGVIVLVAAVPPVALFMRRAPESMGLQPDGEAHSAGADPAAAREIERSWTAAQALRSRNFWLITAAFSLTGAGLSATLLHQITFLRDRGLAGPAAAWVLGATAGMGVLGKLGFGALLDRFGQRAIILLCFGLQALGVVLLIAPTSAPMLTVFVVVYGFAMGGNATLWATVVAACFGRLHYGAIAGGMTPFIVFVQALSIPLTGAVRDATGRYEPAFAAIIALTVAAILCIAGLDAHARPAPDASPTSLP